MQSAIVTYPDGHQDVQRILLPTPPSPKLEQAFQSNTVLYLHAKEAGYQYCWNKNGSVKMFNSNTGIMYEWLPKPTLHDAIHTNLPKSTYIFKKDGTVIQTMRPYPFTSPTHVWALFWPASPTIILVDGEIINDFTDESYEADDESDESDKEHKINNWDYEIHEHPGTGDCYNEECVPCPECGGPYDGLDHGGLGCSRRCAYGDWIREGRRDQW